MQTKYERDAYQFLSAYRFLSYALAIMFLQITPGLSAPKIPPFQVYIILAVLGIYTLLRVFSLLRWRERSPATYAILIGDFLLCILLVVLTNGLNSSFLLYSLTPIITAALLFEEKMALSLAATASLTLSIAQLVLSRSDDRFALLTEGPNLTLLIVYTLFCFVVAYVPFRTNLNIRRRIERDAIIEERRRIGREIHDGVAQSLGFLHVKTRLVEGALKSQKTKEALAELDEIRKVTQDTYENVREAIDQLSTETRTLPIVPALSEYSQRFGKNSNLNVQFMAPRIFPQLSPVAELQLLRIAQEALTNVRRHAQASRIEVKLSNGNQAIEMTVKDDGGGFVVRSDDNPSLGYHGLNIIKERAKGLGGTLTIASAPGQGTEVKVSLPLEKVRL